jgi:hypothetical protein
MVAPFLPPTNCSRRPNPPEGVETILSRLAAERSLRQRSRLVARGAEDVAGLLSLAAGPGHLRRWRSYAKADHGLF